MNKYKNITLKDFKYIESPIREYISGNISMDEMNFHLMMGYIVEGYYETVDTINTKSDSRGGFKKLITK